MENYKYLFPILLFGFLIYRRIQKTIGFQKYTSSRLIFRIVLFSIVAVVILAFTVRNPMSVLADLAGVLLGISLVYFAIKNTIFEKRDDGLYYRTHIWIELTVLFLFFARLIYRVYKRSAHMDDAQAINDLRTPITSVIFFIICTYYIGYFIFILRQAKTQLPPKESEKPHG